MSYDIKLVDAVTGDTLKLDAPHHMRGGTYAVGGTTRAHLNVTYNYYPQFSRVFDVLTQPRPKAPEWLRKDGRTGQRRANHLRPDRRREHAVLDKAIGLLADDVDPDYWKATDGNAKRALVHLRALAAMRPDGLWAATRRLTI
jgi:hypothetical protein